MERLRATVEVGRSLRQQAGIKSRIPLAELRLFGELAPVDEVLGPEEDRLLVAELNVRSVARSPAPSPTDLDEGSWAIERVRDAPVAALSRRPTEELLEEGWYRELARRLQQRRKELGLRYADRVQVVVSARGPLLRALVARRDQLARELLADRLDLSDAPLAPGPEVRRWEFGGVDCSAEIRRSGGATPAAA